MPAVTQIVHSEKNQQCSASQAEDYVFACETFLHKVFLHCFKTFVINLLILYTLVEVIQYYEVIIRD